ncbi:N-acetylmuramoyl-L-alanine amidase family protein [Paenibacillus tarimensis]|uniref:N-acetylmuramoyl-L-alanine amidase family protein n=1 Tax=Paenibacillus tarimensis TaxID=416012 RepID=UPI001F40D7A8|nr:N-acetylmuramoyl-L-alanine amidase [Paenibacillus tarimensis]MCF2943268.1 N-acetylmuramoyl-L-alanine amidase [Paenibacillus tarimensis]
MPRPTTIFTVRRLAAACLALGILLNSPVTSASAPYKNRPQPSGMMPEAEILIDVGHGGIDSGTSWNSVLEKDINLAIASRLYLLLRSHHINAVMNRTGDYALSEENRWHYTRSRHRKDLSQRKQLSEEIPVTAFVSLHVNWSSSAAAHGPVVIHQPEGRSAILAASIQNTLNAQQQMSRNPHASRTYFLLRRVKCPAVIVETGFLSNDRDRGILTNPRQQQRIAEAICSGIRQYMIMAE